MTHSFTYGKTGQEGRTGMRSMKREELKLVIGIIIISLLGQPTTMLSPALSAFQSHFPGVGETTLQALITLPSLISIPFFFAGGMLSRKVSTKHMLYIGIALLSVGGLLPVALSDFSLILACRAVMGMGMGLVSPFSQSLISDNFEGREITLLFGIQAAAISAGNMIGCYSSGYLASIDYHVSFLCYLLGPIALAATVICVPKQAKHPAEPGKSALSDYLHIPLPLWLRYLFQILFALVYFAYFNNASLLMASKGIGDSSSAGITTALSSLIGIAAGLLMPKLHDLLKYAMIPSMTGAMMAGMFAMVHAESVWLIHVASFLIGFAYSVVMPYVVANLTQVSPGLNHTVTSSLFVAANGIGAAVSAVALEGLASLCGMEGPEGQVYIGVVLAFLLTVGVIVYSIFEQRACPKTADDRR